MRKKLLVVLSALAVASSVQAKEFLVFFGTYSGALSKGIYVSRLDGETGKLSAPELAAETPSPAYLAVSPDEKTMYAVGEPAGKVSAFAIDRTSGHLTLLNEKSSTGAGPCHLSTDAAGRVLLVANYAGGSVKSFQLNQDGSIGADGSFLQHHGSGVNTNRQAAPHAHFIHADPSDHYALECDLGTDKVMIYKIDPATGTLAENPSAMVPPGSGPRHLAFSPDGKFVHILNEMGCSVTTFSWDAGAGKLEPVETISALPPGMKVESTFTAAEILVSGNHVYATIRGHDSVSVLTADEKTVRLTFLQNVSAGGKVPRGLGIDPTGHWLITGNQKSNSAVEFAIDPATGKLSPTGQELKIGAPVDVKFVDAK